MFGFQGGELPEDVERKREYMLQAKAKWPFLTYFDLSTIKNPIQLRIMIRDRLGLIKSEAAKAVDQWMVGKDFSYRPVGVTRSKY